MENSSTVHRPSEVLDTLKRLNFQVAVSVPDSWLGGVLEEMERDPDILLIRATHEEEALAMESDPQIVVPPFPFNPAAIKQRFMDAIGAPPYVPSRFGQGRSVSA